MFGKRKSSSKLPFLFPGWLKSYVNDAALEKQAYQVKNPWIPIFFPTKSWSVIYHFGPAEKAPEKK